ncbi:odorant receptor 47a-like [Leptopilina boulardi]|uniref:odorant receptor 47a-like n=1 Tax=Leptopilina boulardi TaxID=63433 RepID=UPI0021F55254|nr:odorant receptor 47a-like [Leptopilina boulardi]
MYSKLYLSYIKLMKYILISCGFWPFVPNRILKIHLIVLGISHFCWTTPIVLNFFRNLDDFNVAIENLAFFALTLLIWATYVNQSVHMKQLEGLYLIIFEDYENAKKNTNHKEILMKYGKILRIVTTCYLIYTTSILIIYMSEAWFQKLLFKAIMPSHKSGPNRYSIDFDYYFFNSTEHYVLTSAHITIGGYFSIEPVICVDVIIYIAATHACAMIKILRFDLKHFTVNQKTGERVKSEVEVLKNVSRCVKKYHRILIFIGNINNCFSSFLFVTYLILGALITLFGSLIILNKSNKVILIRGGLTIIGQLTHMFFNCYCGQVVKSQSSSLINYMYETDWYSESLKVKKMIFVMMMGAMKESNINIGKTFVLSFDFYASMMKTMFSYLNVLNSRQY